MTRIILAHLGLYGLMDNTGRVYSGLRVRFAMPELLTSFELILLLGLFSLFFFLHLRLL